MLQREPYTHRAASFAGRIENVDCGNAKSQQKIEMTKKTQPDELVLPELPVHHLGNEAGYHGDFMHNTHIHTRKFTHTHNMYLIGMNDMERLLHTNEMSFDMF